MRRSIAPLVIGSLVCLGSSCSYHRAHIDYSEYADKMPIQGGTIQGEKLGKVSANEGGAFWNDCTKSARGSIWLLMDQTHDLGGNAIGEIRWLPAADERTTEKPTCKKKWAWFLVWPVMVTPVFMSTRVEAEAYRIESPAQADIGDGLYAIPETVAGREALAERIVAEASRSRRNTVNP